MKQTPLLYRKQLFLSFLLALSGCGKQANWKQELSGPAIST
jgi:hypothetical protein